MFEFAEWSALILLATFVLMCVGAFLHGLGMCLAPIVTRRRLTYTEFQRVVGATTILRIAGWACSAVSALAIALGAESLVWPVVLFASLIGAEALVYAVRWRLARCSIDR